MPLRKVDTALLLACLVAASALGAPPTGATYVAPRMARGDPDLTGMCRAAKGTR